MTNVKKAMYEHAQKILYDIKSVSKIMGPKRSKEQIITQILALCQGEGAIKTKIVYQVGLNFRTVVPYLSLLTKKGHIEATEGERLIYRTTVKGDQALELLLNAEEICS